MPETFNQGSFVSRLRKMCDDACLCSHELSDALGDTKHTPTGAAGALVLTSTQRLELIIEPPSKVCTNAIGFREASI
jgi:hypothetical protein